MYVCIYIYIYIMYTPIVIMTVISSEGEAGLSLGLWRRSRSPCYLCLKKTLLRRRRPFDNEAFRAPNQRRRAVSAAGLQGRGCHKRAVARALAPLPLCIATFASQRAQHLESLSACSVKFTALLVNKKGPGPPNPWNKSCAVNSFDPNWV